MTTRIYIAGPITGHPDHKVAFARAAEAIRRGGCEPVNATAAAIHWTTCTADWRLYLRPTR